MAAGSAAGSAPGCLLPCGINKIIHGALHVYFRLLGRHIADCCCSFCPVSKICGENAEQQPCHKPYTLHLHPPSSATQRDPQQPNPTQPDPDPDSDSEIALTLQAGGKLEVLCAKFLWQEGRQVWKLHEVAPSRLFYRLFFCCCCRVLVMHSRKYVFDYYDSSRLCNFMNMNGLYVCSRFSRYFAGSLGEDKTNCNAVRWLPDDD